MIQRALISGLTSTGVHVADLRISPAAVTRHVLKTQGLQAGVHVGRSSADPEMINVRVFEWPGNQMSAGLQNEVEKHFSRHELRRATFAEVGATTYPARVRESYAQDILDSVDMDAVRRRRFRVAIDYGYSPAAFTLPLVLGPLGVEAIGTRGFYVEDDTAGELESFDTRRIVTGVRADLGVVLGLLLVVRLLALAGRPGRIAVPLTATRHVDDLVQGSSLEIVRTQHSLADLTRAATEDDVVLAAAPTGGFVFPDVVSGYDAVTALCKILELLAGQERPVSELVAELPRPTLVHHALPCPWSRKGLVMRLLNEHLAPRRLDLSDGVKAYDERGWVQVVPDEDEPLVQLYVEGETEELTTELAEEITVFVDAVVQGDAVEQRTLEQASS
jgi:phosphomannomutase